MNIFLLGNGFDLNHNLLTQYINFISVVCFLKKNYDEEKMQTTGDVLASQKLWEVDSAIRRSYEQHANIYHETQLPSDKVRELLEKVKDNCWFDYFSSIVNSEKRWIDCEREIGIVISAFRNLFEKITPAFAIKSCVKSKSEAYIVEKFGFFYDLGHSTYITGRGQEQSKDVKKEYIYEDPIGSKITKVNTKLISKKLCELLNDCGEILKLYLLLFVDEAVKKMVELKKIPSSKMYDCADRVISFNYTNTFECFYGDAAVEHIHGSTENHIILGVNPEPSDEQPGADPTFVGFKKYYQRVRWNTDLGYLMFLKNSNHATVDGKRTLHIIGHSLDETDKDVIKEMINISQKVYIYHHDDSVLADYIENLNTIFGKLEFDNIRKTKELWFLPLGKPDWPEGDAE